MFDGCCKIVTHVEDNQVTQTREVECRTCFGTGLVSLWFDGFKVCKRCGGYGHVGILLPPERPVIRADH